MTRAGHDDRRPAARAEQPTNVTLRGRFYHAEIMVDGQRHRFSTKRTSRAEAERIARASRQRLLATAALRREQGETDSTFDDAANLYWTAKRHLLRDAGERSSKHNTRRVLKRTVLAVGAETMCSRMDLGFFIALRTRLLEAPAPQQPCGRPRMRTVGLMPKTINGLLAMALRVLKFAEKSLNSSFPNKPDPQADALFLAVKGRGRWLHDCEQALLLRHCDAELRDMLEFALEVGLRANELVNLRWSDVDTLEESITVAVKAQGLDVRTHTVFLSDRALEILDRREGRHDTYVFTVAARKTYWRHGERIRAGTQVPASYNALERRFLVTVAATGLTNLTIHDLRRTAARRIWWEAGLEVAQAFLGHCDRATTLAYLGLTEADTTAAIRHRTQQQARRAAEIAEAAATGTSIAAFDDRRIARIRGELDRRLRIAAAAQPTAVAPARTKASKAPAGARKRAPAGKARAA